jgi:hypothetical protein
MKTKFYGISREQFCKLKIYEFNVKNDVDPSEAMEIANDSTIYFYDDSYFVAETDGVIAFAYTLDKGQIVSVNEVPIEMVYTEIENLDK